MNLGSNNSTDSLIFSFDSDNPKSFKGAPVENNIVGGSSVADASSTPWLVGNHAGCATTGQENVWYSKDRPHVYRYFSTNNTGYAMINQRSSVQNVSGQTYTYAVEFKPIRGDYSGISNNYTIYPDGYKIPAGLTGGNALSSTVTELEDGWYRWVLVYTCTYTGNNVIRFNLLTGGYNGNSKGNFEVLFDNFMYVYGNVAPPYHPSIRDAGNSAIDLMGNVVFDVTEASFNNDGILSFDGGNDQMILDQYADQFNPDENFTVIAHLKLNDIVPNSVFLAYGGNGSNGGFLFQIEYSGGLELAIFSPSGSQRAGLLTAGTLKYDGEVVHIAGTFDGYFVRFFVNGVLAAQTAGTYRPNTQTTMRIGNEYNRSYYGNFDLYSMKLYNRALSVLEVQQDFKNARGKRPTSFDLGKFRHYPAPTAQDILNNNPDAEDGVYWLQPSGVAEPFQVPIKFYLGKGMVCVMKGGQREGFVPDSTYWENSTLLNETDFNLINGSASKYPSYTTVGFSEWYFNVGDLDYQTTFTLTTSATSMLAAQQRGWNDTGNRDTARFGKSIDYRTLTGADASITSNLGTEIYPYGMDLKHQGHYSSSGSSGGRTRAGAITDESTNNTNNQSYGTAGSAYGIGVNGGNPLKTGVCGYAGWAQSDIYGKDYNWSLWVIN